jgi:hypothetical protein
MRKYPQTMINVRAAGKVNLDEHAGVAASAAGCCCAPPGPNRWCG